MPFLDLDGLPERELVPGFRVRFVHTDSMTFAYWAIDAGAALPEHAHPHEQVGTMLEGRFAFTLDGQTRELAPGEVVVVPPDTPHGGRALTDCRILDVFHPVRDDYR